MSKNIKVALAGAGAFGIKHLDGIKLIDGVEVVSLIGRELPKTQEVADKYGIAHVTTNLHESLALNDVDAVILCTPTQMHASQSIACLKAGKHVQVEIPLCDVYKDGAEVVALQKQTGLVAMCGHTRRFNPSHQFVHQQIQAGQFNIHQMDVQTYFFRRTNMNALGQARSWTDHLLWHHAAHTVDLFAYQAGSPVVKANAVQPSVKAESPTAAWRKCCPATRCCTTWSSNWPEAQRLTKCLGVAPGTAFKGMRLSRVMSRPLFFTAKASR